MRKHILRRFLLSAVAIALPVAGVFANTTQTVTQVSTAVTVAEGTDYHISGSTPFVSGGSVNLTKGGTAVVILDAVKPSSAASLLGTYVRIGGERAVRGTNCDIRIHSQGTIILPYTEKDAPLTVYSGQNYGGTAVSDFGLEDDGGFMVTLTDAKLNNKIRSFKLRRGFMVTFSTRANGYGYSRCFIAADEDLNVPTLPAILDRSISSYRVFKWNDNAKKGLANNTDDADNTKLRTTSAYSFGLGRDMGLDFECVRHHIYEGWPAISGCGENNYTTSNPTIKTNNEPGNSADDHPQDVATVLANWQELMRTGKRLCSPSSHDGSLNWLRAFMDSIDARGWRCDVLDMHCYWTEGSFSGLQNWYNSYHRPIWVSEWIWGASWNRNGAFGSGVSDNDIVNTTMRIVNNMEGWDYVERYFYWNSESKGHLLENGNLTTLGERYAALNSKVGFKSNMQYVPTIPKAQGSPSGLSVRYNSTTHEAVLTWHEPNGEYNQSMTVETRPTRYDSWTVLANVDLQEAAADYTCTVSGVTSGSQLRIHTVYADGTDYSSLFVDVVPDQYNAGAAITVDGKTLYAGGNIIANGDFAMGTYGWTNGAGAELSQPHFQVVSRGGYDDTPFLQAYSNTGQTGAGSIYTTFDVQPNTNYYVSGAVRFPSGSQYSTVILKGDGLADSTVYTVPSNSDTWKKFGATFNTGNHSKATLSFRWLAAQAEYGQLSLQRLFDTQAEAIADGEAQAARRAELEKAHPTFAAKEAQAQADSLAAASKALQDAGLDVAAFYTYNATTGYIDEPQFTTTVPSWVVASTYTGGTQARSSLDGTTCWTALWTGVAASEGTKQSLEVRQQLQSNLSHGVYMLSVDAAADHLCLTDQHGYFSVNGDSLVTPTLTWDVADLPTIDAAKKWQTLSTVPVYVDNKTAAAIGFTSTKAGATDNAWKPYGDQNGKGDQREGSWYATNFSLLHLPVYRLHTDAGLWRGICLPYAVKAADNLKLYTIAGKSADGKNIYLQAVDSVEAGQPCVANVADTVQMVLEEGTPVTRAKSIQNGLRGYLETSSRAAQNTLVLKDGYWQTQTSSVRNERAALTDYMAIIRKIDDVPVLDSWSGVSLPVDSSTPTAISNVSKDKASAPVYYFDLSGRRVSAPVPGNVYIRVQGDKVEKVAK